MVKLFLREGWQFLLIIIGYDIIYKRPPWCVGRFVDYSSSFLSDVAAFIKPITPTANTTIKNIIWKTST